MKEKALIAVSMAIMFLGSTLAIGIQAEAGTRGWPPQGIYGEVTDETTGRPVYDALVQIISGGSGWDETDANGNYFISVDHTGSYTLRAVHIGFNTSEDDVYLSFGTPFGVAHLDFELDRKTGVSGYVLDMDNDPIGGATVVQPGPIFHETDVTGYYHFYETPGSGKTFAAFKDGYWMHMIENKQYSPNQVLKLNFNLEANSEQWVTVIAVFCSVDDPDIKTRLYWTSTHSTKITVWDYLGGSGDKTEWSHSITQGSHRYNVTGYGLQQKVIVTGVSKGEASYSVDSASVKSYENDFRTIDFDYDALSKSNVSGGTFYVPSRQPEVPGYYFADKDDSGTYEKTVGLDLTVGLSAKFVSASITLDVGRSEMTTDSAKIGVEFWNYGTSAVQFEWYMDEDCDEGMILHLWEV
jgi:hypothetical protein